MYKESEDTFLMNIALKKFDAEFSLKGKKVLELGCGNAYNIKFCKEKGAICFASDIDKAVIDYHKKNSKGIKFLQSDIFSKIKEKFDLIFFNPPYLPSDTIEDITLDGLEKGRHFIDIFLKDFDNYLEEDGKALLLQSSLNSLDESIKKIKEKAFNAEIYAKESFFFERLYVLLIYK